jgi:charged multivesicular body protein 7
VKTYESSTATLRALLAHPSLQRDAVDRTFDALADANADARELDEAVRSGMDVAVGVDVSADDEDEIKAELAALEAEAMADARIKEDKDTQQPMAMAATRRESVSEAVPQRNPEQIGTTRDLADAPERRPEQPVLAE